MVLPVFVFVGSVGIASLTPCLRHRSRRRVQLLGKLPWVAATTVRSTAALPRSWGDFCFSQPWLELAVRAPATHPAAARRARHARCRRRGARARSPPSRGNRRKARRDEFGKRGNRSMDLLIDGSSRWPRHRLKSQCLVFGRSGHTLALLFSGPVTPAENREGPPYGGSIFAVFRRFLGAARSGHTPCLGVVSGDEQ